MTSSTSTAIPAKNRFDTRVAEWKTPKSDINALILDYLTMAGYPKAAAKFSKEANLQPLQDESSIRLRREIQNAILSGDMETAIEALNDLDPEILDKDPNLHFSLLRLQLVELIRKCSGGDITAALNFATEKLAPRASTNPKFLEDLEKTMTLLLFPHDTLNPELAALLKSDLRCEVASRVNEAIVYRETNRCQAALNRLFRMRAWAETTAWSETARTQDKDLPDREPLGIDLEMNGADDDRMHEDGHEPMITT